MHLFFVQRDPDVDHIAPILYKLSLTSSEKILVICFDSRFQILSDYRFQFLKIKSNIRVVYWYEINFILSLIYSPIIKLSHILNDSFGERVEARLFRSIINKFFSYFIIKANEVSTVTLDEAHPNYLSFIIDLADKRKIPIMLIPTGVGLLKSDLSLHQKQDHRVCNILTPFMKDKLFVGDVIYGSPRYCHRWQEINKDLLEGKIIDNVEKDNRLKVLIFSWETIGFNSKHKTVGRIFNEKGLNVIFKDKPRLFVSGSYNHIPSAQLIQWADVVICSASSVVLDIFYYDKIFLYPKYLSWESVGKFEEYNACWKVESEDELIKALRAIKKNKMCRPYNINSIKSFYNDAVYVDGVKRDVLSDLSLHYLSLES